ncbi:MAG TPA: methylenetetrahydrofolate reductase [NAD(P)H] [Dehalococcoidia bacterium]|nr:methylenetetrahydrofolate reductase [NAD(P)H] [Dehalococcoidia bacterium]
MRLDQAFRHGEPTFSFEFFPPRDEVAERALFSTIAQLRELDPTFVSVTYGAGGSTRTRTLDLVVRIRRDLDIEPVAHFSCVGATVDELRCMLDSMIGSGIDNVLALRGDPPQGEAVFTPTPGGLEHGHELVKLICGNYDVCVGAACYPERHIESPSDDDDMAYTRLKQDSGASYLISNLFFDNRKYFDFVARARRAGITVPIIPGIMPVTNVAQIRRFTQKIGATLPAPLIEAFAARQDDPDAVLQLGVAWATLQCTELLAAGAPGIHFYTLNRSPATRAILSALRVSQPWRASAAGAA